jgi:hypothetical protein
MRAAAVIGGGAEGEARLHEHAEGDHDDRALIDAWNRKERGERRAEIPGGHSQQHHGSLFPWKQVIAEHMTMTRPRLGDRVLLVDDMVDSGHTLQAVHAELPRRFPHIVMLRTAVLWWKGCSVFRPDYHVEHLPDSPWIHQPFEVYDSLRPAQLAARLARD